MGPLLDMDVAPVNDDICMVGCPDDYYEWREKLAATKENCYARIPGDTCTMNSTELQLAWGDLVSNTSETNYWAACGECLEVAASAAPGDISSELTLRWVILYCVVGWLVAVVQAGVVYSLHQRMQRILSFHDIQEPERLPELLN